MAWDNGELVLYRRLVRQLRPYWRDIAGVMLLNLLTAPLMLLMPVPLKVVVDSVIGTQPLSPVIRNFVPHALAAYPDHLMFFAVGLLVGLTVLGRLQSFCLNLLRTYTGEKMVLALRTRLFAHMQCLSVSYHDLLGTTDSTYRIQYDTMALQTIAIDGIIPFISSAFTLAGMTYVIFHLDWQLALVAVGISPFLYLFSRAYRKRLRTHARSVKRLESSAMSVVQEVLGALRVVKAFGQEDREGERFQSRFSESMRARVRMAFLDGQYGMLIGLCTAAGTAAVLLIGTSHVRAGTLSLGDLLLVMGYLTQFYEPLRTLSKKSASLQSALASVERVFTLLDETPDVPQKAHSRPLVRAQGRISFRDVSFAYAENPPVLQGLSFDVMPGTRVGIAGMTGVGKTTLMSLLNRFYDPTEGTILLDDVDLREYALSDLRNQFAIVQQEPVLFSVSIAENIAYARPSATKEEIERAAAQADAHQFICRLPSGYDTVVGERGMRLSGGERQRISLARAFLKDAPILILDEPTSSVDLKTEATIVETLERLMRGRTAFIVAHRLSTLKHCNMLLYIDRGHLVPVTSENILSTAQG